MNHLIVDGHNLLYVWRRRLQRRPGDMAAAQWALARELDQVAGVLGGRLTVVFDGRDGGREEGFHQTAIEVVYAGGGLTADTVIERTVRAAARREDIVVVTDDVAERDTVATLGAEVMSCRAFLELAADRRRALDQGMHRSRRVGSCPTLGDFFP